MISIVSHGQCELVATLLRSIDRHLLTKEHEVLIVVTQNLKEENNYSSKFTTTTLTNLRRKGFGSNHNSAFEAYASDFFLIVNPDIVLEETFDLDLLVTKMCDNFVGISSPLIVDANNIEEDYKRSDLTLYNLLKRYVLRASDPEFDWYAGMFLIVRSDAFRSISGFDPKFFMYVEDCDLCMRARRNKVKLMDFSDVTVKHLAQRASRKNLKHFKWHLQSLIKYWFSKK